ncbi:MAG TPA: radical SAM protein [Clostridia bacterium]|nr:radical SAM protein [Clostridia bacterium]
MTEFRNKLALIRALLSNLQIIRVKPSINWFLTKYMGKFNLLNAGGQLIIHSHLPSVNSKAFTRFIDEHLLARTEGPSHAQIGLTNACPQNCRFCYNRGRNGELLNTAEIEQLVRDLKKMGVFWLGFTGGEPLLNKDIVEIIRSVGDDCAVKLFTTGFNLTEQLAAELKQAGLLYVSVSLDHWKEEEHDRIRGCKGAFRTALKAIDIFKSAGVHVSVSAVISRKMLQENQVVEFLEFLIGLGIHEAWLSEAKPTVEAFWNKAAIITEEERLSLVNLQDKYNKEGRITVNYLGHFEGGEHFGCNAGNKMVYIDAFGEVSPCVFTPMTFGNVRNKPVQTIFSEMKEHFPSESCCFINKNYELLKKHHRGQTPISKEDTLEMMKEVRFGPLSDFSRMHNRPQIHGGVYMKLYKLFSLAAAAIFAVVGFIFLFFSDSAMIFFNSISGYFGLPQAPTEGTNFYLILASAYMYLVTLLACLMYRYPEQNIYPFLLAQGKLASSIISIYLFVTHRPYLIYFANFIVDGFIGIAALFFMKMKKQEYAYAHKNNADIHA